MNIFDAIMRAADQIEWHPELWDYDCVDVPTCDGGGCALGRIGYFLGIRGHVENVAEAMGLFHPTYPEWEFYNRIQAIVGEPSIEEMWPRWADDHRFLLANAPVAEIARALRAYAHKYHAPKPSIPTEVRAIFETAETA